MGARSKLASTSRRFENTCDVMLGGGGGGRGPAPFFKVEEIEDDDEEVDMPRRRLWLPAWWAARSKSNSAKSALDPSSPM